MLHPYLFCVIICVISAAYGATQGLLLLYRPLDVSNDCAFSGRLRFDLSFGMGMSDTITMVFRTLSEVDYTCNVDIVSQNEEDVYLIVVIKFPTTIAKNCHANGDAFNVMKKNKCLRLCDLVGSRDIYSTYFVVTVKGKIRFKFLSNNSINSDINADMYQVTVTSARLKPTFNCNFRNETLCVIDRQEFCFTSGVVCDGIKNCGVSDWFDERKSECSLPIEYLGYAPVIAVVGALICALLAGGHILIRCLPPLANSFFIFNANEDNRLCIDPMFKSPGHAEFEVEKAKKTSLIPVSSSSSSSHHTEIVPTDTTIPVEQEEPSLSVTDNYTNERLSRRKTTMKSVTAKIQQKIRLVTNRGKMLGASLTGADSSIDDI